MTRGLVAYLGGMELPDGNAAALRIVANARVFRDLGYEVILIGVNRDQNAPDRLIRCAEDYFGFECWSIPYPVGLSRLLSRLIGRDGIIKFLRNLVPRGLKAVVCYNYPAIAQLRIQKLCKNYGIKQVADVTEWYDASGGSLPFRLAKFSDTWLRMNIVHKRCHGLITTSDQVTAFYTSCQPNIVELPSLFDITTFPNKDQSAHGGPLRLIYVGRPFEPNRVNKRRSNLKERLDLVIDSVLTVASEGHDLHLEIYGIHLDEFLSVFPDYEKRLMISENIVTFGGKLSNSQARDRISNSDFSVFFRDINRVNISGFPTKLSESISCGTPAITSRLPNLVRYESLGFVFLAQPGNETSIIRAAANMPRECVHELKRRCKQSSAFDYRPYIPKVEHFCKETDF